MTKLENLKWFCPQPFTNYVLYRDLAPLSWCVLKEWPRNQIKRKYKTNDPRKLHNEDEYADFRKEFLKGNDESLSGCGSGSETEIVEGGAKDFGTQDGNGQDGDGFGNNEGDGFNFGDPKDNSNAIGDEKGDGPKNNDDGFMDENDFSGKPRKKAGFGIKLIQRDPDEDEKGKQVRSMVIGGDIEGFIKHPDFNARF